MRWLLLGLILLVVLFQYQLWFGENSLREKGKLESRIHKQVGENEKLKARNQELVDAVSGLKEGSEGIEERARRDLGMVREGETFYMTADEDKKP